MFATYKIHTLIYISICNAHPSKSVIVNCAIPNLNICACVRKKMQYWMNCWIALAFLFNSLWISHKNLILADLILASLILTNSN